MKNCKLPTNNAVRRFRYYQKLSALRANPEMKFGLEVERCKCKSELIRGSIK